MNPEISSLAPAAFIPPSCLIFKVDAGTETPSRAVQQAGYFRILEADWSNFDYALDNGGWVPCDLARGFQCPPGLTFRQIRFRNRGTNTLNLVVEVGHGTAIDGRTNIVETRTGSAASAMPSTITRLVSFADAQPLNTWIKLLPSDANRAKVELWTDAATAAYWAEQDASADVDGGQNQFTNIVETADFAGFVTVTTRSEIWVNHANSGTAIRARVHCF